MKLNFRWLSMMKPQTSKIGKIAKIYAFTSFTIEISVPTMVKLILLFSYAIEIRGGEVNIQNIHLKSKRKHY